MSTEGLRSWSGECAALYLVMVGLGLHGGPTLLVQQATVWLLAVTLSGAGPMVKLCETWGAGR